MGCKHMMDLRRAICVRCGATFDEIQKGKKVVPTGRPVKKASKKRAKSAAKKQEVKKEAVEEVPKAKEVKDEASD